MGTGEPVILRVMVRVAAVGVGIRKADHSNIFGGLLRRLQKIIWLVLTPRDILGVQCIRDAGGACGVRGRGGGGWIRRWVGGFQNKERKKKKGKRLGQIKEHLDTELGSGKKRGKKWET